MNAAAAAAAGTRARRSWRRAPEGAEGAARPLARRAWRRRTVLRQFLGTVPAAWGGKIDECDDLSSIASDPCRRRRCRSTWSAAVRMKIGREQAPHARRATAAAVRRAPRPSALCVPRRPALLCPSQRARLRPRPAPSLRATSADRARVDIYDASRSTGAMLKAAQEAMGGADGDAAAAGGDARGRSRSGSGG